MTLLLCEINPDAQDDLLALGYQWGQSRVDAGRILASAGYARLHTSEEFLADIAAARAEYKKLAEGGTEVNAPKSDNTTRSAAIYNMAGEQVNDNPNTGVYIQSGKK